MLWRGCLIFRQYRKNKRHKYGVKFYELCTHNGLVLEVAIYGGQAFGDEQTGAIVVHLMSEFLNKGYHLFTDNWYNSVSLTEFLSQKKTYVTGTLRTGRKRNPKKVMSAKLKKGEMKWMSLDEITVAKWKAKKTFMSLVMPTNQKWFRLRTGVV